METQDRRRPVPLMIAMRLEGAPTLVVGGGNVAVGRVQMLLEAGAQVTVIAPHVSSEIAAWAEAGEIVLLSRVVDPQSDLSGYRVVFTAIDDELLSAQVAHRCRALGTAVNVADVPELCDFFCVARGRRGNVQVAVSTNGQAPGLAARLRDEVLSNLPIEVVQGVEGFSHLRRAIRKLDARPEASKRRMHWLRDVAQAMPWPELAALDVQNLGTLLARYKAERGALMRLRPRTRASSRADEAATEKAAEPPTVYLVGAGPGDPELLTLKAHRLIRNADLVLIDRLVPAAIRQMICGEVRIANKLGGRSEDGQKQLTKWMLEGAAQGRTVVRLKIGDPTIFGRAGEEIRELTDHGVRVQIVPGISSVLSAPIQAGISTTVRGVADRILILTGQGQGGRMPHAPQWDPQTTYIYLMAVSRFDSLAQHLVEQGFAPETPAACIERATHPDERTIRASLKDLPLQMKAHNVQSPATIIIGEVCRAHEPAALRGLLGAASAA